MSDLIKERHSVLVTDVFACFRGAIIVVSRGKVVVGGCVGDGGYHTPTTPPQCQTRPGSKY